MAVQIVITLLMCLPTDFFRKIPDFEKPVIYETGNELYMEL